MVRIVGTKIRKLREEMELTQEDLAKSVGLSSEFISLLELGRRSPSLESLSRIAKFLDKEISFFILEKEQSFDSLINGERIDSKTRRLLKKFRKYCNDYLELEEMTGRKSDLAPVYMNVTAEKMAAVVATSAPSIARPPTCRSKTPVHGVLARRRRRVAGCDCDKKGSATSAAGGTHQTLVTNRQLDVVSRI